MSERTGRQNLPSVVKEEQETLDHVSDHLKFTRKTATSTANYDEELVSLRDAIKEAHPEDVPPLVEQMTRIQALAAQRGLGEEIPVDIVSPYFGHLRLQEADGTRDVLLGKHTYLSPESNIRIVDWRHAPVSRIYYSYEEDDEYEETFGGKQRKGRVLARRSVTIKDKQLLRVASPQGLFAKRKGSWIELDPETSRLAGGQGKSIRAEGLSRAQKGEIRGTLGVDADGVDRKDKHLPEIAALLDKTQFDLISSSASGVIVLQGGAGSGKTTVGLHRIAYLTFQEPERFRPHRIIIVVFNQALVSYISRVLPALEVHGVQVITYQRWATMLRMKHIKGLPRGHSGSTPFVVSRLKKHPAILPILDDIVDRIDEELTERFFRTVSGTPDETRVQNSWKNLNRVPLDARRYMLLQWLKGKKAIGNDRGNGLHPRTVLAAESALTRMEKQTTDVVSDWADLFTDREALERAFELHAPQEFTSAQLDEVHEWCVDICGGLEDGDKDSFPVIDREDEAILLRLHQLKRGWLRGQGGRLLYDHLMVDEAQDFSPVELAVLMQTVRYKHPVTFAGDTAQKIVRDSGFNTWEELLDELDIRGRRMAPLEVAYRSTAEVMRFSQDVLGPLAGPPPKATRHGAPVELHQFSDPGQAVGFLGRALRDLALREPMANVAVIARHLSQAHTYYEGLKKSEIPRLDIIVDEDFSFSPGVEVTEVRQVKGLEFDYVILVEVNADSYPDSEEARHLLHVGATRAAHQLWLVTTGVPSPILPKWLLDE